MTKSLSRSLRRVLDIETGWSISLREANAILEVVYLAAAVDGTIEADEIEGFRAIAEELLARVGSNAIEASEVVDYRSALNEGSGLHEVEALSDASLNQLLDRFSAQEAHKSFAERLRSLGPELSRTLTRSIAYKLAFALSVSDLNVAPEETAFQAALAEVLGLSVDDAEALEGQVFLALEDPEPA